MKHVRRYASVLASMSLLAACAQPPTPVGDVIDAGEQPQLAQPPSATEAPFDDVITEVMSVPVDDEQHSPQPEVAPSDLDNPLRDLLENRTVLITGGINAVASVDVSDPDVVSQLGSFETQTWDGMWTSGDALIGADSSPGIGGLAGWFALSLLRQHDVHLSMIGAPQGFLQIQDMLPNSATSVELNQRVNDSGAEPTIMLMHQGEDDVLAGTDTANYEQTLAAVMDGYFNTYPSLEVVLLFATPDMCGDDTSLAEIRTAQQAIADQDERVLFVNASGVQTTSPDCSLSSHNYLISATAAITQLEGVLLAAP